MSDKKNNFKRKNKFNESGFNDKPFKKKTKGFNKLSDNLDEKPTNFKPRKVYEERNDVSKLTIHHQNDEKNTYTNIAYSDRYYKDAFIRLLVGTNKGRLNKKDIIEISVEKNGINADKLALDLAFLYANQGSTNIHYLSPKKLDEIKITSMWNLNDMVKNESFFLSDQNIMDENVLEISQSTAINAPKGFNLNDNINYKNIIVATVSSKNEINQLKEKKDDDTLLILVRYIQ